MKYIDAELIKSTQSLYSDIDSCIDVLLKARTEHNQENEGKALFRMEGLMVATLQQLSCIIDSLQQEQPKVDLEKELDTYYDSPLWDGEPVSWMTYTRIARHFYELGQLEMRHRITNPEYNAKVIEQLKSEYPARKEDSYEIH